MTHDVFISHSAKDKSTADAVCAMLERDGVRCWIAPRDVAPGQDWAAAIVDAIAGAKVFVLLFSASANASAQVRREVERAASRELPIIPFRMEPIAPNKSLEFFISAPHWLDAFPPPLEAHIARLAGVIRTLLAPPTGAPEAAPWRGPAIATQTPAPPRARRFRLGVWGFLAILCMTAIAIVAIVVKG